MTPVFYNKDGSLTAYALACGYLEQKGEVGGSSASGFTGIQTTMWREHDCYHVRKHDFTNGKRIFWYVTPKLGDARRVFKLDTDT